MNPAIERFLENLDGDLAPVRAATRQVLDEDATIEPASGAVLLSHRASIGPEAYACVLYPGIEPAQIDRYVATQISSGRDFGDIPPYYRAFLTRMNGASLFRVSLFGIPLSMIESPPRLDRSARQPLDLGTANLLWRNRYGVERTKAHFGGGPHSYEENVGYFLTQEGGVETYRQGGEKIGTWASMPEFLADELARCAAVYPEYERRTLESRQEIEQRKPKRPKRKTSL